jgi:nitrogen regulatory protein PII
VKAGARGGTVLFGRGAGVHEHEKIFGMSIEPEKEVVLTIVHEDQVDTVLAEIVRAAELDAAGHGMAFVLPVHQIVGVADSMMSGIQKR